MGVVVTFTDYRPVARFDGHPWTTVKVSEAPRPTGPWTVIDTQALDPLDPNPQVPQKRSFTTEEATLEDGWFKVTFRDEDGDESDTAPIWSSASESTDRPSVDEVALLLRTRTIGGPTADPELGGDTYPGELVTFTAETRPSASEVDRIILTAYEATTGELAAFGTLESVTGLVRHAVSLYAAILVETSFFREQANDNDIQTFRDMRAEIMKAIRQALTAAPGGTAEFAFGTLKIGGIREAPTPYECANPMFGIDF
jgi:hypothetical protein